MVASIAASSGSVLKLFLESGFIRLLLSTCAVEVVLVSLSWFFVLDSSERHFVKKGCLQICQRIRGLCNAA